MSDDYMAGRTASGSRADAGDPTEFDRGERDRLAALAPQDSGGASPSNSSWVVSGPPASGGGMDLSGLKEASRQTGIEWAKDPDGTLKSILRIMFGFTILGGILGFLVGSWLHDGGLWLTYAKLFFFFATIVYVPMIVAATVMGRGTARGCLTIVFLGGLSAFWVWTYALYPSIFSHIH